MFISLKFTKMNLIKRVNKLQADRGRLKFQIFTRNVFFYLFRFSLADHMTLVKYNVFWLVIMNKLLVIKFEISGKAALKSFFACKLSSSCILNVSLMNDFIFMNVPFGAFCGFVNSDIYLSLICKLYLFVLNIFKYQ